MGPEKKSERQKAPATQVAPRVASAVTDDDDAFLAVAWPIDTSVDTSGRPLTGSDIERFRARHHLKLEDVTFALCLGSSAKFNVACRLPSLPFTLEMLMRIYDESPSHAPWGEVTPQAAFEMLYGSVVRDFAGSPVFKEVQLDLYARFAGAIGRSRFAALRWIRGAGNAKGQVTKVFGKLSAMKNPRETLERLARVMYTTRRHNFDSLYPMPSLAHPPEPRRRGPKKGSKRITKPKQQKELNK